MLLTSVTMLSLAPTNWPTAVLAADQVESVPQGPGAEGPVYKPRRNNAPRGRIGGGLRAGGPDAPVLYPLAPDHVGYTHVKDPCFFWYISKTTSSRLRFTLVDSRQVKPVLDTAIAPPAQPGIQMACLKSFGVGLEPEVQYRWYVTVIVDPEAESRNQVIGGTVERTNPAEDFLIRDSCKREEVGCLSVNGLWYDAITAISDLIATSPKDHVLRLQRAFLLEQVGLSEVAQYDRNAQGRS